MNTKHKPWYAIVLVSLFLLLSACSNDKPAKEADTAAEGQPAGGIAVYGSHDDIMTFWDPSDSYSNEIIAMNNMYETLLRYDTKDESFKNILAETYNVSDDGLTWTFTLRKDVKFHTGNDLTAEAAKASIERTIERGKGAAFIWDPVEEINAKDTHTLEFKLSYPAALDTIVSSGYAAFIFDAAAAEENGGEEWFNEGNSAGTGPYSPEKWDRGSQLILDSFDEYWGEWEADQYQKVVFKTIQEANTRLQMAKGGELQFVSQLPNELIKSVEEADGVSVHETESFQQLVMMFNTEAGPLKDSKVRQALAYAIPYDNIIQDVLGNTATQSFGSIPAGLWGHDSSLHQYNQDLDKAKQLLEEAGVDGGELTLTYVSSDEEERQIAELLKIELAKIGFELELKGMLWDAQWDMSKATNPEERQDILLMYWWPDYADPYSFMKNLYASEDEIVFNLAYYKNEQYDQLVDEAQEVAGVDRDKAIELYKQAQQILVEEVPGLSLYDRKYIRVINDSFGGYEDNPAYPNVVFFHDTYKK
ncbi:ABC transporter substrate-binding protein [Mesobacillus harenae]|uniref:ABC transporter substrate-binding protein n=1 Tax=Mesobacillus harenae TaxID=2213203 RepID=UPI0015802F42|nr:ABC transporter substrate-binding protein [Mesobacillus harenae]